MSRPKTAPTRSTSAGGASLGQQLGQPAFTGGKLRVSVLTAEKYTGGSKLVFGKGGDYTSKLQVYSLDEKIGESIVNHGGVDEDFQWAGYEDDFKLMSITYSPIVRFVIYDCERVNDRQPLGWALVSLVDIPQISSEFSVTVPIQTRSDVDSFDPKAVSIVGSIAFKIQFEPYTVAILNQLEDYSFSVQSMSAIRFGVGWSIEGSNEDIRNGNYTTALVMLDRNGNFIDAIESCHPRSKRGPRAVHRRIPDKEGDGFADVEGMQVQLTGTNAKKQANVYAYFLVLVAKDTSTSLRDLSGGLYLRIVHGNNNMDLCRYAGVVNQKANACIIARIVKNAKLGSDDWVVKVYGQLENTTPYYGALLPEMRDLLSDVIPNCKGSYKDTIKYATVGAIIELSPLLEADQNSVVAPPPDEGEADTGEPPVPPQDVTTVSIGLNWIQIGDKLAEIEAGCLMLDNDRCVSDSMGAEKSATSCGSVTLAEVDKEEEGLDLSAIDHKVIQVNLTSVPENVSLLAFYIVNGRLGENLQCLDGISAHVFETDSKREVIMLDCPEIPYKTHPTLLLCLFIRKEGKWSVVNASQPSPVADLLENGAQLEEYVTSHTALNEMLPAPAPKEQNDTGNEE